MGVTRITYTPRGDSPVVMDFWAQRGVNQFSGGVEYDGILHISRGGIPYRVSWDTWHQYRVELRGVKPAVRPLFFERVWAFWSHCLGGGSFSLALDSDLTGSATLPSGAAQNTLALTLSSSAGFGGGDWVFIEDAVDRTRFLRAQLRTVPNSSSLALMNPLSCSFSAGSVIRHAEFFPRCILLSNENPFTERDADRGAGVWDLKLVLRTVR